MKHHLNYIILHDGKMYHLFERMRDVPFEAYNPEKSIFSSENLEEVLENRREVLKNPREVSSKFREVPPENLGKSENLGVPRWQIEESPYEVVFND